MKELERAQPLVQAREIFRGEPTDAVAVPFVLRDNERKVHATGAMRSISSIEREYLLLGPNGPIKLKLPNKANISGIVSGRLLVALDEVAALALRQAVNAICSGYINVARRFTPHHSSHDCTRQSHGICVRPCAPTER
ncbi:prolyl oligopeptidase PreP (S9A serine peptidase family) [Bradyrhizobium sp. LM2.7]